MEQSKHIDIPTRIEDWTWDTIINVVNKHEFEPGRYDYKDALRPTGDQSLRDKHIDSLRRTACSMANTDGGFLLFGVKDQKKSGVAQPEERIIGISTQGDLRKEFGDKLLPLQPELYFDTKLVRFPNDDGKGVFVVQIPQSQQRPHMISSTGIYYRRGEGGQAVIMNHYEVREQMMNTEERLRKVTLLRLEIRQYRSLIQAMLTSESMVVKMLYRFDTSAFKPLLADICSLLPTSDNLLSTLLQIPLHATMINLYLEKTSHPSQPTLEDAPGYYQKDAENIRTNLKNFQDLCFFCDNRLEALFGQLEGLGPITLDQMSKYGPK